MRVREQLIAASQQEQQMRDLAMQRTRQQLALGQQFMSGPDGLQAPSAASNAMAMGAAQIPSAPDAGAGATNMGGKGPTVGNAALMNSMPTTIPAPVISRLNSMSEDQITGGVIAGVLPKEVVDLWQASKMGRPLPPGWRQNSDGSTTYVPTVLPPGLTYGGADGKTIISAPGQSAVTGLAGATKDAEMRATNRNTPVPLERLDRMRNPSASMSVDDLLQGPFSGSSSNSSAATAGAPFNGLPPQMQRDVLYSMSKFGPGTVNGQPLSATAPAASGGFKSPADLAAENLLATQGVHAATDPLVKFNTDRLVGAHTNVQAVYDKLSDTVRNEAELQNRNNQLYPLLDKIQTGGFAPEQRIQFANALQTAGWVPAMLKGKVAEWVAGGDPTTGKVIENQLAAAGIKTMLDTLDKEGKPNRAIFQAIQSAQESAKSGNATLKQVFDLQKQLYDWHFQQEQELGNKMASPDYNPITTLREFSANRNASLKSATPAANSTAQPLPSNLSSGALKVGTVYQLPNGESAKWDGFKFRGGQ
jgi:hypothetical protein